MELNILESNQIIGTKQLEIFKKYGTSSEITDFAILHGGSSLINSYKKNQNASKNRTGRYWTSSRCDEDVIVINELGKIRRYVTTSFRIGVRPCTKYSLIKDYCTYKKINKYDVLEVEYGKFPKNAVSKNLQKLLDDLYVKNKLCQTDKCYSLRTLEKSYQEYEYNGKCYIRVPALESIFLSNNVAYCKNNYVWISVEPLKWLVDEKNDVAITKDIIQSGIPMSIGIHPLYLYEILNTNIKKDIIQNIPKEIEIKVEYEKTSQEVELENLEKSKQKILQLKKKLIK